MSSPYDQIADQWHSNSRGQDYISRVLGYIDRLLVDLPLGAKVLDLGCGTGDPIAKYIVKRGFSVTGIDESEKMLEIAREIVPEAKLILGDIVEMEVADQFAAVVAWDSLFHVERKHHLAIYRKIANCLEVGGRMLLSIGGSDVGPAEVDNNREGFTSEMFGHRFFYSAYLPQVARRMLESGGFAIEMWEVDDPSSRGHIAVIARRVA